MTPFIGTAAVIGANGYVGRNLAHVLDALGWTVHAYSRNAVSVDGRTHYRSVDITDDASMASIDCNVDVVFLFAGLTGNTSGFERYSEFIDLNEKGLLNVVDRLRETGSSARLVFPSTRLVYRGQRNRKLREEDEKAFKSIYAINKISAERYLQLYQQCFGIRHSTFRICVTYGNLVGDGYSYGTVGHLMAHAVKGEPIRIYGDGRQRRSFIHIEDLCRMLVLASTKPETLNGCFNLGGPEDFSIIEVAEQLAQVYDVGIEHVEWPDLDRISESGDTVFDSSRLEQIVGDGYRHTFVSWVHQLRQAVSMRD